MKNDTWYEKATVENQCLDEENVKTGSKEPTHEKWSDGMITPYRRIRKPLSPHPHSRQSRQNETDASVSPAPTIEAVKTAVKTDSGVDLTERIEATLKSKCSSRRAPDYESRGARFGSWLLPWVFFSEREISQNCHQCLFIVAAILKQISRPELTGLQSHVLAKFQHDRMFCQDLQIVNYKYTKPGTGSANQPFSPPNYIFTMKSEGYLGVKKNR
uniref:Uncharacterized protein n=1 Tax=Timema bartmani TaxID=61472 RepID=A0A7R9F7S9_9NEOP|nr:unnamed protein product [Timema bartmani]